MIGIRKIIRLRNGGIFRDFQWPTDLPEFGRYNLIYGWNGTGKTTISRILRALELRQQPDGEVVLCVDNGNVCAKDFLNPKLSIRVFNRDFIYENVFRTGGGDIPPIFVLGKESIEKQQRLDTLKAQRTGKQQELDAAKRTKEQAEQELDKHCINQAKRIKETLRRKGSAYNEYDKRRYRDRAQQMASEGDASEYRLDAATRDDLLRQHEATQKSKVAEVSYQLPDLQQLAAEVRQMMQKTVVSSAIQNLKDDSVLADWVRHGLALHKDRKSNKCLFCEQPLLENRLKDLEAHFNTEYERFLQGLEDYIRRLKALEEQAAGVKLPHRTELYDDLAAEYDGAEQALRQALDAVRKCISELINALNEKKSQPFRALPLRVQLASVDNSVVDRVNNVIRKHNKACDEFDQRVQEARDRLALDMIAESLEEFVQLQKAVESKKAEVDRISKKIEELTQKIRQLESDIVEHRRPAEELNEDLRKYLGHDELRLEIQDTGYTITRHGKPAQNLSEGEMTAIALLYFLKSLEDRGFDKNNGIVVLDDPVSSLDAHALYLAFAFICQRTEGCGQLFILTHNFTFFRQVRNWFHHLKGQRKSDITKRPARFYMLDCAYENGIRCSRIRLLDPLLEQYESEYHYLFARIYRAAMDTGTASLEQNYELPNMARRLLEAFLAFRQPATSGGLLQKMEAIVFDEAEKKRILRFLHTHSHSDAVGDPGHDPSLLAEAGSVLKNLLALIESQDKAHYDEMVKLVTAKPEEED